MIPLQSNHPISTLVSILFTMQWSILINNPTPKSIIQLLSETILFHSVFPSLFYPHNQILSNGSRICDHWIITCLAMGKTHITPNYCYSNKQVLSHSIHLPTNHIPIILTTLQQLLVCSLSSYHTIVNHEDDIHNPAQTMCHHSRMILSPRLQRRQELLLMLTVQRTRRFVQKKDRGIAITPNAASDLPTPPFPQLLDRYRIDQASRC